MCIHDSATGPPTLTLFFFSPLFSLKMLIIPADLTFKKKIKVQLSNNKLVALLRLCTCTQLDKTQNRDKEQKHLLRNSTRLLISAARVWAPQCVSSRKILEVGAQP